MSPGTEINDDLKIRWAQLITVLSGTVAVTALLVSMRHELASLRAIMTDVVRELREVSHQVNTNDKRIDALEWRSGGK